jgi:excisionase family DNA binding protein
MDNGTRLLFPRKESAQILSLSVRTLDYLIASKAIAVVRVGRKVLVPRLELEKFARRGEPRLEKATERSSSLAVRHAQ